jgi:hypothetical protein
MGLSGAWTTRKPLGILGLHSERPLSPWAAYRAHLWNPGSIFIPVEFVQTCMFVHFAHVLVSTTWGRIGHNIFICVLGQGLSLALAPPFANCRVSSLEPHFFVVPQAFVIPHRGGAGFRARFVPPFLGPVFVPEKHEKSANSALDGYNKT